MRGARDGRGMGRRVEEGEEERRGWKRRRGGRGGGGGGVRIIRSSLDKEER